MADPGPRSNPLRRYAPGIALVLAWFAAPLLGNRFAMTRAFEEVLVRVLSGFPGLQQDAIHGWRALTAALTVSFTLSLFAATFVVPLGYVTRRMARARVRAVHADPLDRVRRWVSGHPRWTAALLALPPAASQALFLAWSYGFRAPLGFLSNTPALAMFAVVLGFGVVQWRLLGAGLRSLLSPTLERPSTATPSIDPAEIRFAAVAVTRETKGAVAMLAALTLGTLGWVATRPIQSLFHDRAVFAVIGGYVVVAALSAWLFQRASTIRVGVDGIYVGGTSRPRFFAYRDLDEVRDRGGDIELVKRDRVLLRLQLHGEDAARREAILARIREATARVAEVEREGAANIVVSRSKSTVARASAGGTDYRMPAVSRDALWSLVEGSGVSGRARTAAAEVLAQTSGESERARMRVAAERCADPKVRVALEELASEEPEAIPLEALQRGRAG